MAHLYRLLAVLVVYTFIQANARKFHWKPKDVKQGPPPDIAFPVNMCAYCRQINDQQCIAQYCLGGYTPYGGMCAYCRQMNDPECISRYCFLGGPTGFGPFRRLAYILRLLRIPQPFPVLPPFVPPYYQLSNTDSLTRRLKCKRLRVLGLKCGKNY